MKYIQRLAEIMKQEIGDKRAYCIADSNDKIIAGNAACEFFLRPYKNNSWRVAIQELGRGKIYEEHHFNNERKACIQFIKITDEYYHLNKYLDEFE